MPAFDPQDPDFQERVRKSFARQKLMETIGARLLRVEAGEVEIGLSFQEALSQQHGYLHAAVVTAIIDSACGYAALSLTEPRAEVLTIEYKVNFLSPAIGEQLIARGRVTRPGRNVTVCAGDAFALKSGREKPVATMLATMITIREAEAE